jgi:metal-responsive CopG/Arc/MetJ family transcriptional regulator
MSDRVTIKIPRELYQNLGQMIDGTGFSSVNEFIVFVMRSLAMGGNIVSQGEFTSQEIQVVRSRLARLGYLKESK